MRVMCVNHTVFNPSNCERAFESDDPKIGDVCEVSNETVFAGVKVYELYGYHAYYDQRNFAHISDIDEMELVNELQQQY